MRSVSSDPVPFLDLRAQLATIRSDVETAVSEVLGRCDFVLGTSVTDFEAAFAAYCEAEYAVGVASGLDALALALRAMEIGPGDEVIVPANTFIATAFAVSHAGARPVLVDCDPGTANIDPTRLEDVITPRTRAVIPVHLYGQPAEMDSVRGVVERHGLALIEDAAQAHGARYKGARVGGGSDLVCFSFYPGKNLGAYGDGGAIVTNNAELARRLRELRNLGSPEKYRHTHIGYNSRLDTVQAAILGVKLRHLDAWSAARQRVAERYRGVLEGVPGITMLDTLEHCEHVYHLFVIRVANRDGLMDHLRAHGIGSLIHYPIPIHLQEAYRHLGHSIGDFPAAEQLAAEALSLPMFAELSEEQVDRVGSCVSEYCMQPEPSVRAQA